MRQEEGGTARRGKTLLEEETITGVFDMGGSQPLFIEGRKIGEIVPPGERRRGVVVPSLGGVCLGRVDHACRRQEGMS